MEFKPAGAPIKHSRTYFVVVHLTVFEEVGGGKQDQNNDGSDEIILRLGGIGPRGEVSLPFSAVLDEAGALVVNSNRPEPGSPNGKNIAFPAEADQIAWFMNMIKRGAPSIAPDDYHVLENRLNKGVA